MSQRKDRYATHPGDVEPDVEVEAEVDVGVDVDVASLEAQAGEPSDPLAAAPAPALTAQDPLREFGDNARKRYELEVSSFAADLRKQALAHKRSHGGDIVSGRDVASAATFLRSHRSNGLLKYVGVVGGVLIGLGAQTLADMMDQGAYTTGGVLWMVGTAVAGVALFVWHATRDHP